MTVSEVSGLTLIIPGTRSGWCDYYDNRIVTVQCFYSYGKRPFIILEGLVRMASVPVWRGENGHVLKRELL